ncbi:hypothetical protein TWF281_007113 [Arthrobotrys megalospora]
MSTSNPRLLNKLIPSKIITNARRLSKWVPEKSQPPRRTIFDVLPNEIIIAIIEQMMDRDRDRFAQCSILCYKFALLAGKSLVLTPKTVARFQDGGLRAPVRSFVRSVRFEHQGSWVKSIREMPDLGIIADTMNDPKFKFDALITMIRISATALRLFPNIQHLYISYTTPFSCELNIYIAILRSMIGYPICSTLQRLEFQISRNVRRIYSQCGGLLRAPPEEPSFETFYSKLSAENQEFLGNIERGHDTIITSIDGIVPKLPELTEARILTHNLPMYSDQFSNRVLQKTAFYYIPLMFAPKLERLCLETTGGNAPHYAGKGHIDYQLLGGILPLVKDLRIINGRRIIIGELADQLMHLRSLHVETVGGSLPYDDEDDWTQSYRSVCKLKNLEYLGLPLPYEDEFDGWAYPETMEGWVRDLLKSGLDRLKMVVLQGCRYTIIGSGSAAYAIKHYVIVRFLVERTGVKWKLDAKREEYQETTRDEGFPRPPPRRRRLRLF